MDLPRIFWFGAQYLVKVHSVGPYDVELQVVERDGSQQHQAVRMTWEETYTALANKLEVNDHQIAAMAPSLARGKVLKFYLNSRREELVKAGFLQKDS